VRTERPRARLLDAGIVLAISIAAAFLTGSRTWVGFNSPDSEFYASLALFGDDIADRSIDPAYTWTRLGYIAPVRLLVTTLDPWLGFAVWRFLLIALIVGSLYAMVRMVSTRQLATIVAGLASLNTMVLSFVGNTYLTGTIIAAILLLLALGTWGSLAAPHRPWLPVVLSGAVAGWLVMLNPYALMLGMSMWLGLRVIALVNDPERRWRHLGRDAIAGIAGFGIVFGLLLAAGAIIFPGRNWLSTYVTWNSRLDYASFVGDPDVWRRDVALLVPVLAVAIALIAIVATRASRWATAAVVVAVVNVAFTWGYVLLVPGPWLEAPTYVAKLWAGALAAVALGFGALVGRRSLGVGGWAVFAAAVPLTIWAGHFDQDLTMTQALVIAALVLLLVIASAVLLRGTAATATGIVVVLALSSLAIGSQLLQNGRGLLGIYGQFPLRAAYVDFDAELLMRSKVAAQEFVLANTTADDTVGIWTDADRLTAGIAAMQLWGWYNNVAQGAVLSPTEAADLETRHPTAIAMYAPTLEQIDTFRASLPRWALPSEPTCTTVPFLGIGSPDAHVCVVHLRWPG
jgi:hypothetical protein